MLRGNIIYNFRGKVIYNFTFSEGVIKCSFYHSCLFALNIFICPIYPALSKIVTMKIYIKKDLIERKLYKVDFIFGFAFFVISGFAPKQYVFRKI